MGSTYFDFEGFLHLAESGEQEYINALGQWFEQRGTAYWNGEYYDASLPGEPSGTRPLYPVYERDEEADQDNLIGYSWIRP